MMLEVTFFDGARVDGAIRPRGYYVTGHRDRIIAGPFPSEREAAEAARRRERLQPW